MNLNTTFEDLYTSSF